MAFNLFSQSLFTVVLFFAQGGEVGGNSLLSKQHDGRLGDSESFTIALSKQHVPIVVGNRTVMYKTAYYGNIYIGVPHEQNFTVVFDTGSGHIIMPSSICQTESCKIHRRYNRSESKSALDMGFNGAVIDEPEDGDRDRVTVQYGTGEVVGAIMKDVVCIGQDAGLLVKNISKWWRQPKHCYPVWMVAASEMSDSPFKHFDFDGVFGLGLSGLALEPEFHFLSAMGRDRRVQQLFGIFLARDEGVESSITFGGVDQERMLEPLQWEKLLRPEEGYWRIQLKRVLIGGLPVEECEDGECSGIVDSGTSLLGVPSEFLPRFLKQTVREVAYEDVLSTDCKEVDAPSIVFVLSSFNIELPSKDYFRSSPMSVRNSTDPTNATRHVCRASLLSINMPALGKKVFLMGEPVLQRHYTAYDACQKRVGFALANQKKKIHTFLAPDEPLLI